MKVMKVKGGVWNYSRPKATHDSDQSLAIKHINATHDSDQSLAIKTCET